MWKLLRNLVLVALLLAGALKLFLWYEVQEQFDRTMARIASVVKVNYDNISANLRGDISIDGLRLTPQQNKSHGMMLARQVTIHTPGLLWLVKRSVFGNLEPPERLSVDVEGLQMPANGTLLPEIDPLWLSPFSQVPFETLGCGVVNHFDAQDYARMGLALAQKTQHFDYRYDPQTAILELDAELDNQPLSDINLHMELSNVHASAFASLAAADKLRVTRASLGYVDSGYLQQRNKFCAQHTGLRSEQFVEQHISAVLSLLKTHGIEPGTELIGLYRRLMLNGGKVDVSSLPNDSIVPSQYSQLEAADLLRSLNLTARYNDAPPVLVQLTFTEPEATPLVPVLAPDAIASSTPADTKAPPTAAATGAQNAGAKPVAETNRPAPAATPNAGTANTAASVKPPLSNSLPTAPSTASSTSAKPNLNAVSTLSPADSAKPNKTPATLNTASSASNPNYKDSESHLLAQPSPLTSSGSPKGDAPSGGIPSSAPRPPKDSTLALVWQDPRIERLMTVPPQIRDYDVVGIETLHSRIGKRVRLITAGGKGIEGLLLGVDALNVAVRVKGVSGAAEFEVPKIRIEEVQLIRRDSPPG